MTVSEKKKLELRRVLIDTYKENVAYLHRNCDLYRSEGFQALNKIEIRDGVDTSPVIAVLNIVDDSKLIEPGQLGLSEQLYRQLGLPEGSNVSINPASPPESLDCVHQKIAGHRLGEKAYLAICRDITANRYSKIEIAAFLVGCATSGMAREEVLSLTKAMVETGDTLTWGAQQVVDKHCIGGIPGNRTTMLIVPIVAAHGMIMPKTSSRAITSPAGTADTMEVLAKVSLKPEEMKAVLEKENAFIAWGGTAHLSPVDDILIAVERPLSMDSPGQMIASILSKKVAAGASHLLIDIPVGSSAKIHTQSAAIKLRKLFEYVGDSLGLNLEVVITDGEQPIGRGIGPVLEARDVMQVLERDPNAPLDLREKSLQLAGRILEFDPDVRGGKGYYLARDLLDSGRALEKMKAIIAAQDANNKSYQPGKLRHEVYAKTSGVVKAINNLKIARIARLAGAPMDKQAGIYLNKKLGEDVQKGELLYTIYAEFSSDFMFAVNSSKEDSAYTIASAGNTEGGIG